MVSVEIIFEQRYFAAVVWEGLGTRLLAIKDQHLAFVGSLSYTHTHTNTHTHINYIGPEIKYLITVDLCVIK